jgi:hypothetical protein
MPRKKKRVHLDESPSVPTLMFVVESDGVPDLVDHVAGSEPCRSDPAANDLSSPLSADRAGAPRRGYGEHGEVRLTEMGNESKGSSGVPLRDCIADRLPGHVV